MPLQPLLRVCILSPARCYNFDSHPHRRHIRIGVANNKEDGVSDILGNQSPGVVNEVETRGRPGSSIERDEGPPDFAADGVHGHGGEDSRIRADDDVAAVIADERAANSRNRPHLFESLLQPLAPCSGYEFLNVFV